MITTLIPTTTYDYQLIDCGNGQRLEQYGSYRIIRPDSSCLWAPRAPELWKKNIDAHFDQRWHLKNGTPTSWTISLGKHNGYHLQAAISLSSSKNIGIFPDVLAQWPWLEEKVLLFRRTYKRPPKILSLFAYTGITSLFLAAHGAEVTHVDSSQPALTLARQNLIQSGLDAAAIRWIKDDCFSFMKREIKRNVLYDGIIMDPPAFGRDHKQRPFLFKEHIAPLLQASTELLSDTASFFLINGYAMGNSAQHLYNVVAPYFPDNNIERGELHLRDQQQTALPCSLYARW